MNYKNNKGKVEALNKNSFRASLRSGFTLIELLVVVIIVGILSAIALPQYELVVEKSRATEGLIISKAIRDAIERHLQEFPDDTVTRTSQLADVKIQQGTFTPTEGTAEQMFFGKYFVFQLGSNSFTAIRVDGDGLTSKMANASGMKELYILTYTYNPSSSTWSLELTRGCSGDYEQVCKLFTDI